MPTMKQMYELTTNLEYEALYIAITCINNDIPFAINTANAKDDDRFTAIAYYNEDNADILMDMDENLKKGTYTNHRIDFHNMLITKKSFG